MIDQMTSISTYYSTVLDSRAKSQTWVFDLIIQNSLEYAIIFEVFESR